MTAATPQRLAADPAGRRPEPRRPAGRRGPGSAADRSVFGMLGGEGYEVAYDYGRSGDDLAMYTEEPGFSRRSRDVAGRPGTEVEFRGSGGPWGHVRMLQVHVGGNVLTVRMNCVDADTCRAADVLFDSVSVGPA